MIGRTSVVPLFHVIVWVVPASQLIAELGKVTVKGAAFVTETFISSLALLPPPLLLSLTKKEKFKSLATVGNTSHLEEVAPPTTVARAGMYLFGEEDGSKDLNSGPTKFVATGGIVAV